MEHEAEDGVVYVVPLEALTAIAAEWDRHRVYHLAALIASLEAQDATCFTIALTRLACMFSVN